jgi:hypothetical protein
MIKLSVSANVSTYAATFAANAKRTKQAIADALTRTALIARADLRNEIASVFDRPTPYTLNAITGKAATAANLEAIVKLKDEGSGNLPTHYLYPQIFGGPRGYKRFEAALHHIGVLPEGMFAIPAAGARLDAYGNMSRGQIVQILSAFGAAQRTAGYAMNRTAESKRRRGRKLPEFFAVREGGHLAPGIYLRVGSAIKPVLVFTRQPTYRKRLRYTDVVQHAIDRHFAKELDATMTQSWR